MSRACVIPTFHISLTQATNLLSENIKRLAVDIAKTIHHASEELPEIAPEMMLDYDSPWSIVAPRNKSQKILKTFIPELWSTELVDKFMQQLKLPTGV